MFTQTFSILLGKRLNIDFIAADKRTFDNNDSFAKKNANHEID